MIRDAALENKFRKLLNPTSPRNDKRVHNLSSKELTKDQMQVLRHEASFNTTDAKPVNMIAAVESILSQTKATEETKSLIRHQVPSLLMAHRPREVLSKVKRDALREFKANKDLVIVPADKGRSTVVLDRTDYLQKAKGLLEDRQFYIPCATNPVKALTREINVTLLALENSGAITPTDRRMARPQDTALVRFYGLPKVHKDGAPLRPIVSLKDLAIETIELILQSKYDETENRLGRAQVLQLQKFCLRTYFTFDGTIYEQVKGTPMGSPISGFIAKAILQRLESVVFQHHKPTFWARYVDDTFVVIDRDQLLTFKERLNAVLPDIQFTMEEEEKNQLAFLDVLTAPPTMPNTRSTSDAHSSSIGQLTAALGNLLTRTSPVALDSLRPPIYEVGDSFLDWRVQAERYLVHLPADQRMDHLMGLLGPTAKRRLNYLCVSPPTTISNLWATLESLFGAQEPLIALHNQFCLRTQLPGENEDSYLDALFSLGSRVFPDSQVFDQIFLRFVDSLRSADIKREFRIRPPANLLTALQTTRIFESAPPQQEPRRDPSSPQGQLRVPDRSPLSLVRPTTRTTAGTASSSRIVLANIQLVTADGSPLRCTGTRQVSIVLPICTAVHPMLVSPDIRVDAIVGLDFLRAHQLIIDPNNPAAVLLSRSAISNISADVSTLDTTAPNEPTSIYDLFTRQEIPVTYLRRLKDTLLPFQSVFTWAGQPIGRTGLVQHAINTGTTAPQRQLARRIPIHYQMELNSIISDLLAQGVIEPSNSPWAAPVTLGKKKDGHLRLCIDYRQLNKVTVRDSFPIPRIDDTIDALVGATWFVSLELSHSYWQIEVRPEHRHKTAFILPTGLYQFNTLPMGLANATATCQRLMQFVLRNLLPQSCLVYLDDIIIHGKSVSHLLQNLSLVLQELQAAGITINPKKCHFLQRQVTYLGHVVDEPGITPDPEKIRQVLDWPTPQSQTDVRSFLGLASYYRRFIYGFANIALPLHRLTEKGRSFVWTAECTQAFLTLKNALTSAPILALPDGDVQSPPFFLDTDASGFAIGAVLSQIAADGHEHVIAYASQCLNKVQRHYIATRREMLALVTFVKKFRHLLLAKLFIVRTDHQALKWLRNFKDAEGQVARWRELLEEFDFEVQYRPGERHNNADTLSRPPLSPTRTPNDAFPVAAIQISQAAQEKWAQMQASDPNVSMTASYMDTLNPPPAKWRVSAGRPIVSGLCGPSSV
nr:unnamed protein product [Spirometra erinaceieuropaei]